MNEGQVHTRGNRLKASKTKAHVQIQQYGVLNGIITQISVITSLNIRVSQVLVCK